MNTHNIISTPDITGNIGTCKTNKETVQTGNTFFTETKTSVLTNSCTGEVIVQRDYTTYGGVYASIFIGFFLLFFIIGGISIALEDTNKRSGRYY